MPPPKYPTKKPRTFRSGNPGVWGTAGKKPKPVKNVGGVATGRPPRAPGPTPAPSPPPEAEADRIIAELLAELGISRDSARREAESSAEQEAARGRAVAEALMALGIPTNIQNIYGNAAGSIGGLAQGFSQEFAGQAAAQGAEQANMLAGTGQEGAVRNEGVGMGDVLYGTQGFIPARGLEQTGAAFASQAALQPGFALQFGQQAANEQIQDYIKNVLPGFTDKEALIRTRRPSLVADAQERQLAVKERALEAKRQAKGDTLDLYKAGLLTQREFAKRMGVPGWRKFPNTIPGGEGDDLSFREIGGSLFAIDPKTGKASMIVQGPGPAPTVRTSGGYIWEKDPRTGKWIPVGGTGPTPEKPTVKVYGSDASGRFAMTTNPDGSYSVQPITAPVATTSGSKSKSQSKPKPKFTPLQQARFRAEAVAFARDVVKGGTDKDGNEFPPLSFTAAMAELERSGIPLSIGVPILKKAYARTGIRFRPPGGFSNALAGLSGKGKPPRGGDLSAFIESAGFTAQSEVVNSIFSGARKYGLDPFAVMAVALAEGGLVYGAVGDGGTSYGPFQLHKGGALPKGRTAAWANSPAGIEYALRKMAAAGARGLKGQAAIDAIVRRFERPADPGSEIERAGGYYSRLTTTAAQTNPEGPGGPTMQGQTGGWQGTQAMADPLRGIVSSAV